MKKNIISRIFKKCFYTTYYLINPVKCARKMGVKVGENCDFNKMPNFGGEPYLIEIGNHVQLSFGISFINHEGGHWIFRHKPEYANKEFMKFGKIVIKDNSYVGANVTILPGVTIGENCIIGAGSVVTKDVPDNSVAVGVPCRVISDSKTFEEKFIREMPKFDEENYRKNQKEEIIKYYITNNGK